MEGPARHSPWASITALVGREVGTSSWWNVDQPLISGFGELTRDRYFLHVDPQRAASTPFGRTIAHGMLTLSLLPGMSYEVCPFPEDASYPLNYGYNRVRFVAPVPVGSRVRGRFTLRSAEDIGRGQRQVVYDVSVEIEGAPRPALVAEWVIRYVMPEAKHQQTIRAG